MDELAQMIEAGRELARAGWKDDEIEAAKRYSRETPTRGLTSAATFLELAQYAAANPAKKGLLQAAFAKPKDVRELEIEVMSRAVPLLRLAAPRWPDEQAEEELRDGYRTLLLEVWPKLSTIDVEAIIMESFTANPRTGWSISGEKAVAYVLAMPPAPE